MSGEEQRVEPGDERSTAIETARSWELSYLEDEPLVIDTDSAARVGGEELARIGAAPVRCGDGSVRVVLADATPERIAGIREHFSGAVGIRVERLRDQEAVDRLKHELADRNGRLERALSKTQELAAIIQGGHLR